MRVSVVALCLFAFASTAEAKHKRAGTHADKKPPTQEATRTDDAPKRGKAAQSFGVPWRGTLHDATRLRVDGERVVIRRPARAYGTRTTVNLVGQAIKDTLEVYPKTHVYAVGDISQESGGPITEHHSHQSGRDIDLGLFYKKKPASYPESFVAATEDNLLCAPTFRLLSNLVKTAGEDGGIEVIFLDYDVQGILYRWAKDHDVPESRLDKMFQYPHGRGSPNGLIHHIRNHNNHIHARFRCASADTDCAK